MSTTPTEIEPPEEHLSQAGIEFRMRSIRRNAEEDAAFVASKPQTTPCRQHPEQVLAINPVEMARLFREHRDVQGGGYHPCPLCQEAAHLKDENERLCRQGVPSNMLHATFDNWTPSTEGETNNLERVKAFVQVRRGFLVMLGDLGTGKTHLAVAVMRSFRDARLTKQSALLRSLRDTYRNRDAADPVKDCQRTDLLVIDEMGVSAGGKDELPMLYDILAYRYEEYLPTILTSNLSLDGLKETIGDRMTDRLWESTSAVLSFSGPSHRLARNDEYFSQEAPVAPW